MLIADWHALANNKMDGDLEKIKTVGKYFIETWKAAGLNTEKVEFVWASDLVSDSDYWKLVLQIAKTNSIKRFIRCAEIMGRDESYDLSAAQILYPCMQVADIFILNVKITQLGMDQRKVNVLAREIGMQLGFWKPVIISHHMILGLGKPSGSENKIEKIKDLKMSKSNPDSAIFMTDTEIEIKEKIGKAWCPEKEIDGNPILEYFKYIVFEKYDKITLERLQKFGGNIEFTNYIDLQKKYENNEIHPQDLKNTLAYYLNKLIEPVRTHFQNNPYAKSLLEQVKSFKITK
jgi:tyrosyl-tRNA synthetase